MLVEGLTTDDIHASIDEQGFSILKINAPAPTLLAMAFEHDIQTRSDIDLISQNLQAVELGKDAKFTFSGNSCTLTAYGGKVTIENDIVETDEPLEMSLDQYRVILRIWAAHLAT